jgi:hypothetical protein
MKRLVPLAILLLVISQSALHADKWAAPTPRIYASPWGTHALKVLPDRGNFGGQADATLFTLDEKGDEKVIWKGKLVNMPHQVLLSNQGKYVATIDTYANLGFQHAIVLYNDKGKAVADYALEELLTKAELAEKVPQTASSRHWASGTKFTFPEGGQTFDVELKWGRTFKIDLATGKLQ